MKTTACFFPFDLFGSAGSRGGAELLADAFREMLDDNRREQVPTRARAYTGKVRTRQFAFETLPAYQDWRERARQVVRQVFRNGDFLLWITGNHLGVLPVYDELARKAEATLVVQLAAHLDIYNLTDCTAELSHGNFLLHCAGSLPTIWNIGSRELPLRPEYVRRYYQQVFPAAELAVDPEPALHEVRKACRKAERVFIDLDCDVFDPAFFPASVIRSRSAWLPSRFFAFSMPPGRPGWSASRCPSLIPAATGTIRACPRWCGSSNTSC